MNPICQERIKQALLHDGIISEAEYEQCLELHRTCRELGLEMAWLQLLLLCHIETLADCQRLLLLLLQEFTPGVVMRAIDPISIWVGPEWYLRDFDLDAVSQEQLREGHLLAQDLQEQGILINLSEALLLKGYFPEHLLHQSITSSPPDSWQNSPGIARRLNMASLRQRWQGTRLLPPVLGIKEIAQLLLPEAVVRECIELSTAISQKWGIDFRPVQVLNRRYTVDPHLVHGLLLADLNLTTEGMELNLGSVVLPEVKVESSFASRIFMGRSALQELIEWSYQVGWLRFSADQEQCLQQHWRRHLADASIEQGRQLQKELAEQGLSLPLTAILFWQGTLSSAELCDGVTQCLQPPASNPRGLFKMTELFSQPILIPPPLSTASQDQEVDQHDELLGYRLLQKGLLSEEQLSQCLLEQIDQQREGGCDSLADIIVAKGLLDQDTISQILTAELSPADETQPEHEIPSRADLRLVKLISHYQILTSQEIGRCLSLQRKLKQAGILRSLEQIFTHYRFIHPAMLQSLLAKPPAETHTSSSPKQPRTTPWPSSPAALPRRTNKHSALVLGALILLFALGLYHFLMSPGAISPGARPHQPRQPHSAIAVTKPVQPHRPARPAHTPTDERNIRWGGIWVTPQEKNRLAHTYLPPQISPRKFRPRLLKPQATLESAQMIRVQGCLQPAPVARAHFRLLLLSPLQPKKIYLQQWERLPLGQAWQVRLRLPRPLLPGRYLIQLRLEAFGQQGLAQKLVTRTHSWLIPLQVGTTVAVRQSWQHRRQLLANMISQVHDDLLQSLQQTGKLAPAELTKHWPTWHKHWQRNYQDLQARLQTAKQRSCIPLFPVSWQKLSALLRMLNSAYNQVAAWLQGTSLIPPRFAIDWQALQQQYQQLLNTFAQEQKMTNPTAITPPAVSPPKVPSRPTHPK